MTLPQLFEAYKDHRRAEPEDFRPTDSTVNTYRFRFKVIRTFMADEGISSRKAEFYDARTCTRLLSWMRAKGYSTDYGAKVVGLISQLHTYAYLYHGARSNPLDGFKCPRSKERNTMHLEPEEVQALQQSRLPGRFERVVDLYLMQCFTGLAYGDLQRFDEAVHMKRYKACFYIDMERYKSGTKAVIPLLLPAMALIQKYEGKFPKISNQKYNDYLKIVAEKCGIEKPLTTHSGRKTCGHMLLNEGVSMESVARVLGHSTIKYTQKLYAYIKAPRLFAEFQAIETLKLAS